MSELEAVDLVKQGISLARGGDKPQARPLLRQVVEREPANEAAWMWLASVEESPQDTLTAPGASADAQPEKRKSCAAAHAARLKVGVAAAKAHWVASARMLLNIVVADEPQNELAWMWLANTAETPADAVTCLDRVLAINPNNALARSTYERCRSVVRLAATVPDLPSAPSPIQDDRDIRPAVQKTVLVVDDDPDVREALARTGGLRLSNLGGS